MKINIRDNLETSISNYFVESTKDIQIYIGNLQKTTYNLSILLQNHNCNILKRLFIIDNHNNDFIIEYTLLCNEIKLVNFTNKSNKIHNYNLLDYLHLRFIDIKQLVSDLYLQINYVALKPDITICNNFIYCVANNSTIKLKKYYITQHINEQIYFYKPLQHQGQIKTGNYYSIISEDTAELFINNSEYYSKIYFTLGWTILNNTYPQVRSITVESELIPENSSQIYVNNIENIYSIDLFPYNNDLYSDFIQKKEKIKIRIRFDEPYAILTKVCVSLIKLNYNNSIYS